MKAKYLPAILSLAVAAFSLRAETLACDLKALTPEQRKEHQKLSKDLASAVTGLRELPDGYTLQIDSAKLPLVGIAQWITVHLRPSESDPQMRELGALGVLASRLCELVPEMARLGTVKTLAENLFARPDEAAATGWKPSLVPAAGAKSRPALSGQITR
jgi:hypothetical protein